MSASRTGKGHGNTGAILLTTVSKATTCPFTTTSRHREKGKEIGKDRHVHTLQPAAQLLGEEDNSQLALAVGRLGVILLRLPVQVIKVYVPSNMSQG